MVQVSPEKEWCLVSPYEECERVLRSTGFAMVKIKNKPLFLRVGVLLSFFQGSCYWGGTWSSLLPHCSDLVAMILVSLNQIQWPWFMLYSAMTNLSRWKIQSDVLVVVLDPVLNGMPSLSNTDIRRGCHRHQLFSSKSSFTGQRKRPS